MHEASPPLREGPGLARWGLPALIVVAIGLILAFVVLPSGDSGRSTLERGPEGTAALSEVLRARGVAVESLRVGLQVLERRPVGSCLVMVAGSGLFTPGPKRSEVDNVLRFAEEGSTVILLTDRPNLVAAELGIEIVQRSLSRAGGDEGFVALPTFPHPLTTGGALALDRRAELVGSDLGLPLFAVGSRVVATAVSVGAGRVVLFADPFVATNAGLPQGGNLAAVLGAIEAWLGDEGVVLFDDVHAGAPEAHGTLAYARRAGLGPSLLIGVLALSMFLWRSSRREGAVLAETSGVDATASSDLVLALASLYQRADLADHALDVLSRRFRRDLEARSGASWKTGAVRGWIEQELGLPARAEFDEISRRFADAFNQGAPTLDRVADLAHRVHRFQTDRLLRGTRGRTQEKT